MTKVTIMDDTTSNLYSDQEVIHAEQVRIRQRRGIASDAKLNDVTGLALSGGGVRSATFNLGLLQALERHEVLQSVDYLSTVSGGGYIGSSYTWFSSRNNGKFPFGARLNDHDKIGGRILEWIRVHGCYLTPGNGLDVVSLLAAVVRGMFINLLVIVPFFLFFMWVLLYLDLFTPILTISVGLFGLMIAGWIIHAVFSGRSFANEFILRRRLDCSASVVVKLIFTGLVVGTLPQVHQLVLEWIAMLTSTATVTGMLSMLLGWYSRRAGSETGGKSGWLLRIGLVVLLYGILLLGYDFILRFLYVDLYHLATELQVFVAVKSPGLLAQFLVLTVLIISILIGVFGNINHVSMHRFYRDRLLEAYMFNPDSEPCDLHAGASNFYLRDVVQTSAPYHIINTAMNTIASRDAKLCIRGGDNFIFSPLYCGSDATGYAANAQRISEGKVIPGYLDGSMDLATAFTISGAAVDPNTGVTRSRPLAFLMSLLNVRLGYWIRNPAKPALLKNFSRPRWHFDLLYEMLGIKLNEHHRHVHLSDGGHFENLAAYELIRRQCRYVVVSDAAADPEWTFSDLAKLIELVRVDFGAAVIIDVSALQPQGEQRLSARPYVVGTIYYKDGSQGYLIYIKTCMVAGLNDDLYSYRRLNKLFPDEPTSDQFFTEVQFEAYRELGFQLGRRVFAQTLETGLRNRAISEICASA
jgi:hypothetical protein